MLEELRIRHLGVIEEAVLPLAPGLTVVTGETGAGKTMVVTGLLLLFGDRADSGQVRTGHEQASVDGRLCGTGAQVGARVRDAGGELDDDELVLRRLVGANGRSRAFVGGAPAPVSVLAQLSEHLIAVHGQADQLRLVRPAEQRALLDRYAGLDLEALGAAYRRWRAAADELADRHARAAELRREADLLTHGLEEISEADPQPGEDAELASLAARLGHADVLAQAAASAHHLLLGDPDDPASERPDIGQLLGSLSRSLAQRQGTDEDFDVLATRVGDLVALVGDLGAEFATYAEQLDADPARLEQVEQRRSVLTALMRKYCDDPEPSLAGVLDWAAAARDRLASVDVSDEALARLAGIRDEAAALVRTEAVLVSRARQAAADELAAAVTEELAGLAMPDARLLIDVTPRAPGGGAPVLDVDGQQVAVSAEGIDEVSLLLCPHSGASARPLGRGASGGELSRVMLALELSLADSNPVPTLVFDEVDAGVGGRAAVEVGRRLARLARTRQVLVVTHLPQVAAFADRQLVVDKPRGSRKPNGPVTASDVRTVTDDERVSELARMLAGSRTDAAKEHAAELLADARSERAERSRRASGRRGGPRK